jgi:hypothetical protein
MLQRIHGKLGTAGFIISIVALVAALGGGAYAASGGLSGKQKKEVEKIAKKFAGKPGAPGAPGSPGPAGAAGAKGDVGPAGTNGTNGTNGKNGLTGFTSVLPAGKTETGTWTGSLPAGEFMEFNLPISFPIPLAKAGEAFFFTPAQVENEEFGSTGCSWKLFEVNAVPKAATPGTLCVFSQEQQAGTEQGIHPPGEPLEIGFGPAGALLNFQRPTGPTPTIVYGTWAVTAAE